MSCLGRLLCCLGKFCCPALVALNMLACVITVVQPALESRTTACCQASCSGRAWTAHAARGQRLAAHAVPLHSYLPSLGFLAPVELQGPAAVAAQLENDLAEQVRSPQQTSTSRELYVVLAYNYLHHNFGGQVWSDWRVYGGVLALAAAAACWAERPRGWADSSLLEVCN